MTQPVAPAGAARSPRSGRRRFALIAAVVALVLVVLGLATVQVLGEYRDRQARSAAGDRIAFLEALPVPAGANVAERFAPATDADEPGLASVSYRMPDDLVAGCSIVLQHAVDRGWTVEAIVYDAEGELAYREWTSESCPTTAPAAGEGLALLDRLYFSGPGIDADEPLQLETDVQGPAQWQWSVGYDPLDFPHLG